jgi:hypothetical protein
MLNSVSFSWQFPKSHKAAILIVDDRPEKLLAFQSILEQLGQHLAQVLGNLLHNARKFTPAGGTATLSLTLEGSIAVLSIRDNGVGIAPEVLEQMFEPFRQARQDLARQHGGLGLLIELFLKRIKWLKAHTNIVETLPAFSMAWRPIKPFFCVSPMSLDFGHFLKINNLNHPLTLISPTRGEGKNFAKTDH